MSRTVTGLGLVALSVLSARVLGAANQTGMNVDYLYDSDNTPLLADVMRTYRTVNTLDAAYNANNAPLDSSGWATSDAWYFLGDPAALKHGDGTYNLKFTGEATVSLGKTGTDGSVVSQTYDPATNTTVATLQTRTGVDLTDLRFSNTQRTADSATNTGVTNIQLMRPTTPGGGTAYSFDTTFTNQTKAIAGKVGVLRFMDYLATNNNTQQDWSDRVKPTDIKLDPVSARSSRGKGGPLELAVQLGNETQKDIWINIPALATNDYITKVAQLIKYGSDGTNPYTSPQANPVFKPLSSNLHVYVEYSNETWNSDFLQSTQIQSAAAAEVAAEAGTNGPLNYTGSATGNVYYLAERFNALRTKQIADTFSGVFGANAMLNTVRPILSWQYGNGNDTANQAVTVLDGYFNNAKGNFVASPTPINSYIYGGGSAMYYSPTSGTGSLTVDKILTEPIAQMASQTAKITKDLAYTTTFGIKRVAYEGGLSLDPGGSSETADSLAAKMAALADPRLQQLIVTNHNTWSNQGGDLLVYYLSTDQYKFAFSDENFSTSTPKLAALDQLAGQDATTAYSVGTALSRTLPTAINGGQFSIRDTGGNAFTGALTLKAGNWSSYLINIPQGGDYTLTANFETYGAAASFKLLLGGAVLADYQSLLSDGKYTNAQGILLTIPQGITSLRVLLSPTSGTVSLNNITFNPIPLAIHIPEPTATSAIVLGAAGLLRRRRR